MYSFAKHLMNKSDQTCTEVIPMFNVWLNLLTDFFLPETQEGGGNDNNFWHLGTLQI
jgi:hypothetical protein